MKAKKLLNREKILLCLTKNACKINKFVYSAIVPCSSLMVNSGYTVPCSSLMVNSGYTVY